MSSPDFLQKCQKDFYKYQETTQAFSAIKRLIERDSRIGRFLGIDLPLMSPKGEVTPDLVCVSVDSKIGLLFEFKWSLTQATAKDYLMKTKKYSKATKGWTTSKRMVQSCDVVFVCHKDDANHVTDSLDHLINDVGDLFYDSEGFSVWTWEVTRARIRSKTGEDLHQMRFNLLHGKIKNNYLQQLIESPTGIIIPPEEFAILSYVYLFTTEKPPIQYTISYLWTIIFPSFTKVTHKTTFLDYSRKEVVDEICNRCKPFFPGWYGKSIQLKKSWIKEALLTINNINIKLIKLPIRRTRDPIEQWICKKLQKLRKKPKYRSLFNYIP